jgi:ankyrin repeat protein
LLERIFPDKPEDVFQHAQWGALVDSRFRVKFEGAKHPSLIKLQDLIYEDAAAIVLSVASSDDGVSSKIREIPTDLVSRLQDTENKGKDLRLPLFLILAGQALRKDPENLNGVAWNVGGLVDFALSGPERCPYLTGKADELRASALVAWGTISGAGHQAETIPGFEPENQERSNTIAINIVGGTQTNFALRPDILGEYFCLKFLDHLKSQDGKMYDSFLKFLFDHGKYYSESSWEMTQHTKEFFRRMGNDIAANGNNDDWVEFFGHAQKIFATITGLGDRVPQFFRDRFVLALADVAVRADDFSLIESALIVADMPSDPDAWSKVLEIGADHGAKNVANEVLSRAAAFGLGPKNISVALLNAASEGHVEIMEALLAAGADINAKVESGATALVVAAEGGHLSCVQALLGRKGEIEDIDARGASDATALLKAAGEGHVEIMEALLAAGADINAKVESGATALVVAAEKGHLSTVQALLRRKGEIEDIDARGASDGTALHGAANSGHAEILEALLAAGADINAKSATGATALSLAATGGHLSCVEALLRREDMIEDINERVANGGTALHWASANGQGDVIDTLLAAGADINAMDSDDNTVLHLAATVGHLSCVQALLRRKDEIEDIDARGGSDTTALHGAASQGHVEVMEALLAAGTDINAKVGNGATALRLAAEYGHLSCVQALLRRKDEIEDIDARGKGDATALHGAAIEGHVEIMEALLAAGANINAKVDNGATALVFAAENGHLSTVQALLRRKDEIEEIDARGGSDATALHTASINGHIEIMGALLATGADINAKVQNGDTALHLAIKTKEYSTLQFLLMAGSDKNIQNNDGAAPWVTAKLGEDDMAIRLLEADDPSHIDISDNLESTDGDADSSNDELLKFPMRRSDVRALASKLSCSEEDIATLLVTLGFDSLKILPSNQLQALLRSIQSD